MQIDLTYNDLLAIAKLITMYLKPEEIAVAAPSYFDGLPKAVEALNAKLSRPEVYQFIREEAEK